MMRNTGATTGRALLDHVPEMVTISDRRGRIVYANPATERVSGFPPEEFASLEPFGRMHPEDRPRCEEAFAELLRNPGLSLELEHRVRHKDGTWRWVDVTFASLFDDPEVGGLLATVRDVTERKRVEETLRESEEKYRGIFDSIDEGFVVAELLFDERGDPYDLLVLETNASFERMMRTTEAVGKRALEIFPEAEGSWFEAYGQVVRTGEAMRFENYLAPLDGWFDLYISRVGGDGSRRLAIVFDDVTERKRAEEALRESEERQAFLLKLSDALRPLADPVAVQETASRLLGEHLGTGRVLSGQISADGEYAVVERDYHRDDMGSGVGWYRLVDFGPSIIEELRNGRTFAIGNVESHPGLTDVEQDAYKAWGVLAVAAVPLIKAGRYVAFICLHSDVSREWPENEIALIEETAERTWAAVERARIEAALADSEEEYRTLFTSIDEGFCTIEVLFDDRGEAVDYRFLETNPAFERQTGLENAVGKTVRELAPEHEDFWFDVYGHIARTGESRRFEHEAAALGRFYDVYAFRIGEPGEDRVAVIFNDILARKQAEEQHERLRALEASARAEASERERISRELHDRVAHHMAVAHQSLELYSALRETAQERAAERFELAREATRTALDQTRDLSAQLARSQSEETREGLTAALRNLLETHVPPRVEVDFSVEGDEAVVPQTVREQAYLVMREAVRNAVAHSGCGRIEVSVEVGGGELRGRVEDDGEGFDPRGGPDGRRDDREDGGPAAGVGLRSMKERTEMLGGRLEVSSNPGQGTAVEVRVPLSD